ncbi:type I polyketide synthase [Anaerocolumna xylanovorans]|uniref:Acyl transferase domain-containing protein n=1 Tax=Anaerocolumna xylanovorans DSM 12503 TaxID=1121345 RepID=A0A1M7YI69_9FIRM|nr:type I polyketide synthase [Anaerocolumna xylanovorans]SHO52322.1 Acyl transferase domain-containing protein [Anaerocolumna xylanovorans DSM 12503]
MTEENLYQDTDIAVIGYSCRFPKANTADEFWENLKNGRDCITRSSDKTDKKEIINAFGKLDNIYDFDANFFGISENTAAMMDPQQRMLLTICYEALENSGHRIDENKRIGLLAGASDFFYVWKSIFASDNPEEEKFLRFPFLDGTLTSKISYYLNLTGPSIPIKAACSTGLTAIHMAVQSLLSYECDIAIAGGVSINEKQDSYQRAEGTLSASGKTSPFDQSADGFVPANGAGVVVLRRLEDSIEERDSIKAVIKGSAINNDGKEKAGYTAPSVEGERRALEEALAVAGVNPEEVDYIETHGTATSMGDMIEIEAIRSVYGNRKKQNICKLGAVKANIGHTNYAAGMAGFLKTVLMLEHKKLVPTINHVVPNSELNFNNEFIVNTEYRDWKGDRLTAGVSSFGIGGANCHVIVQEYTGHSNVQDVDGDSIAVIPISARSTKEINKKKAQLLAYCEKKDCLSLQDIAYTLQTGREPFECRTAIVCSSFEEFTSKLLKNSPIDEIRMDSKRKPMFMFGGNNKYSWKQVKCLSKLHPVIEKGLYECFALLSEITEVDYEKSFEQGNETELMSTVLVFCVQYALGNFLKQLGVMPEYVFGYSSGEFLAAYFAGIFSLSDALRVYIARNRLFESLEPGLMISVMADEKEIAGYLRNSCEISAFNAPNRIMVSGIKSDIDVLKKELAEKNIYYTDLSVERAGHCALVKPILGELKKVLERIDFHKPKIRFLSSAKGRLVEEKEICTIDYWIEQTCLPVSFRQAVKSLGNSPDLFAVEISIGQQLSNFFNKSYGESQKQRAINLVSEERESLEKSLYIGLGNIWSRGCDINWQALYKTTPGRVALPSYPFEYKKYQLLSSSVNSPKQLKPAVKEIALLDGLSLGMKELRKYLEGQYDMVYLVQQRRPLNLDIDLASLVPGFKEIEKEILSITDPSLFWEQNELESVYDQLCVCLAADYFKEYEIFLKEGERISYDQIISIIRPVDTYKNLLDLLLGFLCKAQYINMADTGDKIIHVEKSINGICNLKEEVKSKIDSYPAFTKHMNLLKHCGEHYKKVINGEITGKEVLYPEGSFTMIREVYDETPTYQAAGVYANILAGAINSIAEASAKKLRILEVGAGTGTITWPILQKLEGFDVEYWFTDIGLPFILEAGKISEKSGYKNVKFKKLDISLDLKSQEIPVHYFDLVVSCAVIQSTTDMEAAFGNLSEALVNGGIQCLLQPVRTHPVREAIGGLTPDWWNYKQDKLRAGSVVNISISEWETLFRRNGYTNLCILEGTDSMVPSGAVFMGQLYGNADCYDTNDQSHDENERIVYVKDYSKECLDPLMEEYREKGIETVLPSDMTLEANSEGAKEKLLVFRNSTDKKLANLIYEILGINVRDMTQSIYEFDIDSLALLMLCSKIKAEFSIEFNPRDMFECSCLEEVADVIDRKSKESMR